jgi:hypothetical protein
VIKRKHTCLYTTPLLVPITLQVASCIFGLEGAIVEHSHIEQGQGILFWSDLVHVVGHIEVENEEKEK